MELLVVCWTKGCANYGKPINTITGVDEVEAFIEGWRPGEDEADCCLLCKQEGVLE